MCSKSENKKFMLKATLVVPKEKTALEHNFSLQTSSEKTMSTSHGIITVIFCWEVPLQALQDWIVWIAGHWSAQLIDRL